MIDALTNLLQQIDDLGVSSYSGYMGLPDSKKKSLDDLFWKYLYGGPQHIREEVKNKTNLAVKEEFPVGIKQSILYADKIIVLTSGTSTDLHGQKNFGSNSIRTLLSYLDLIRSGLLHLVPVSHRHLGEDEYDDSYWDFDPAEWSSILFRENLLDQIRGSFLGDEDLISNSALLNLNVNFPLVGNISDKEIAKLIQNEELLHNYRFELRKLHSFRQGETTEASFLEQVKGINDRVVELNARVNELKLGVKLSLIETTIGASATICSLFLPAEIAVLVKSIVGATTLVNVSSSAKAYIIENKRIKESPYYFAWRMLK